MTLMEISPLTGHHRVRYQSQGTGALDRRGHLALMLGAIPRDPAGDDLAPLGDEVLERPLSFKIPLAVLFGADAAPLLAPKTAASATLFFVPSVAAAASATTP